ncbi:hypothetical protein QJS10_CPA06g00364 [Acorus calamus]|uniref:Phosphoadenosine phosphosulphate reductase domain-containing protein n=1 Tax=Acorus calamus TaxID=4465 RepID=A0AAV9EMH2_ACOCL|nr:hypothetical protein QJS10_CPA06g00364 [Acorus calamus]
MAPRKRIPQTASNHRCRSESGAEDVALIEYARLTGRPFRVFSLDTGRLNPKTYRFFDAVEKHYDIHIEYMFPDSVEVQALIRSKGLFSFYEDGHQECCRVRKVRPLRRALKGLQAWITGQRKDQSPGTRAHVPIVQVDPSFEGMDGGAGSLVKWNPLANVEGQEVLATSLAYQEEDKDLPKIQVILKEETQGLPVCSVGKWGILQMIVPFKVPMYRLFVLQDLWILKMVKIIGTT